VKETLFGANLPEASRDLANELDKRAADPQIWVPQPARQYRESGVLKAACPECGCIYVFNEFARAIAFICDNCGMGSNVAGDT